MPLEYISQLDEAHTYDGAHKGPKYHFVKPEAEAWLRCLAGEDIDPWDEEHGPTTRQALGLPP